MKDLKGRLVNIGAQAIKFEVLYAQLLNPLRLFDLPQEIQNLIFDLAYSNSSQGQPALIMKYWWTHLESERHINDINHLPRPFPYKINDFPVSKRFFVAAAQAYVRSLTLEHEKVLIGKLFDAYGAHVNSKSTEGIYWLSRFPRLKSFEVGLKPVDFSTEPLHLPTNSIMNDEGIFKSKIYKAAKQLSGIQALKIGSRASFRAADPRLPMWNANLQRLESLIKEVVTGPRFPNTAQHSAAANLDAQIAPLRLHEESGFFFDRAILARDWPRITPTWYAYGLPVVKALFGSGSKSQVTRPNVIPCAGLTASLASLGQKAVQSEDLLGAAFVQGLLTRPPVPDFASPSFAPGQLTSSSLALPQFATSLLGPHQLAPPLLPFNGAQSAYPQLTALLNMPKTLTPPPFATPSDLKSPQANVIGVDSNAHLFSARGDTSQRLPYVFPNRMAVNDIEEASLDVAISHLRARRAGSGLQLPPLQHEDIPDTDQGILRMLVENPVGILA